MFSFKIQNIETVTNQSSQCMLYIDTVSVSEVFYTWSVTVKRSPSCSNDPLTLPALFPSLFSAPSVVWPLSGFEWHSNCCGVQLWVDPEKPDHKDSDLSRQIHIIITQIGRMITQMKKETGFHKHIWTVYEIKWIFQMCFTESRVYLRIPCRWPAADTLV